MKKTFIIALLSGVLIGTQSDASQPSTVDPWNQVSRLAPRNFPWQAALKDVGIRSLHICGDRNILPTKKSMQRSFHVGPEKTGYLITGLFPLSRYFQILTENNLAAAKETLQTELSVVRLWKIQGDGKLQSLGAPRKIQLPFTATIKDCVEGARTTLGNDCSRTTAENRVACCREKFIGPVLEWSAKNVSSPVGHADKVFQLHYSPDPSVSLQVPQESVRYCNVSTRIEI